MKILNAIGNFFKGLFTFHNVKAIGKVAEDVAVVAADAASGNIPGVVVTATQLPADASNIKVTTATPSSSTPSH
jgi:glycerate-2-kinase